MSASDFRPAGPQSLQELRELAESAARVGGELARASLGQPQVVSLKADRSEVTEVDLAAERAIVAHIRDRRPNDAFIGEEAVGQGHEGTAGREQGAGNREQGTEGTTRKQRPSRNPQSPIPNPQSPIPNSQSICWVIDPLDGTRNYVRSLPIFACSVAAMRAGEPVAAAIFDPVQNVMYSAALGHGVYVDGRPASPTAACQHPDDPKPTLLVGIPSTLCRRIRKLVLYAVERHVVRNLGSTALHLALVATGQLDAAVSGNSKLWDIAAGLLLITEAGGVATSPDGGPVFPIDLARYRGQEIPVLAGNPTAHARLMREAKRR